MKRGDDCICFLIYMRSFISMISRLLKQIFIFKNSHHKRACLLSFLHAKWPLPLRVTHISFESSGDFKQQPVNTPVSHFQHQRPWLSTQKSIFVCPGLRHQVQSQRSSFWIFPHMGQMILLQNLGQQEIISFKKLTFF